MKVGSPGTATTLSVPGYTVGDTSITVGSTSNWSTDTGVAFAIDQAQVVNGVEVQAPGTYNEYVGTVASGTSVSNVSWVTGSGDRNYSAGALTRVYIPVSATRENRIVDWGLAHANQDGTLKNNSVTTAAILDANVTTPKIADANVTTPKIADGAVTPQKQTNPYKFHVYRGGAFNSGNNAFARINFEGEVFDTNNNFDSTTNYRYTAPVAGFYYFYAQASFANAARDYIIAIYKNGTIVANLGESTGNASYNTIVGGNILIQAAANDYFEIYAYANTTTGMNGGATVSFFGGWLVSIT